MSRNVRAKKIFALLGYMGVGKDTLLKQVLKDIDDVKPIISTTTRPMRKGETEGVEYYFIDDTEFFRRGTDFVEQRIYHTKVKENGIKAVEKYKEVKPDLVLMDITMPELDGIGALKQIKELDPNASVIMCSAMGQQAMVIEAIQAGAIGKRCI